MWLITPIGFFSVVQKPGDVAADTLTIRARVRADLDALREQHLPGLGEVLESNTNDYRFRAVAPRHEVASAMAAMVNCLDYANFKNQVSKVQGASRAHLYHDVWDVLYRLQTEPKRYAGGLTPLAKKPLPSKPSGPVFHPRQDRKGRPVQLQKPSKASTLETWHKPEAVACVLPDGQMPSLVNGIPIQSWANRPTSDADWLDLAGKTLIVEPPFVVPPGYRAAAGVVVREKCGRVWVVAPSNAFGGYQVTFPKGTVEAGMTTQAAALVEAWEESGLRVRLLKHLVDVKRSQSYTRYYLAERLGGNPADMGWETQAVMLAPESQLSKLLNSHYDLPILEAIRHA